MKNYSKILKVLMWVLLVISVVILVWGFVSGFETNNAQAVDVLFYWAYFMLALAILSIVVVALAINAKNNPKFLLKTLIVVVVVAAVCGIAYALAPGSPAVGITVDQPSAGTLKLTDTVLNLTYALVAAAILSIVVGEIVMAVRNKK